MNLTKKLNILISPLDWGLGHTTRMVPIIDYLVAMNCNVIIATNEIGNFFLKSKFSNCTFIQPPAYNVQYTSNKLLLPIKIISQIPRLISTIKSEHIWLEKQCKQFDIDGIISDNRYGMYHKKIPSVFITHQLQIQTPFTWLTNLLQRKNYKYIEQFSDLWIVDEKKGIAGSLSHPLFFPNLKYDYIGFLSRFSFNENTPETYDLTIVLSGPEPQRTILEKKLIDIIFKMKLKIVFVRGVVTNKELKLSGNITFYNYLLDSELNNILACSKKVICRAGYTSIMDLIALKKQALLIPTPGQTEQEYLANHLQTSNQFLSCTQHEFNENILCDFLNLRNKNNYENYNFNSFQLIVKNWLNKLSV